MDKPALPKKTRSAKRTKSDAVQQPDISLSTPWGTNPQILKRVNDLLTQRAFIKERSRVHALFIEEEAKTKRISLLISALLALGGGALIIFAPEGKQLLANWVGVICFVSAGGAAGYKRLWFKSKAGTVKAL